MKKLYRPNNGKMLAGVCKGISDYFGVDPTLVRLLMVLITLFTGIIPGLIFYIAAWIIIPES